MSRVRHFGVFPARPTFHDGAAPVEDGFYWNFQPKVVGQRLYPASFVKFYWRLRAMSVGVLGGAWLGDALPGGYSSSLRTRPQFLNAGLTVSDERELCFPGLDSGNLITDSYVGNNLTFPDWNGNPGANYEIAATIVVCPGDQRVQVWEDGVVRVPYTLTGGGAITSPGTEDAWELQQSISGIEWPVKFASGTATGHIVRANFVLVGSTTYDAYPTLDVRWPVGFTYDGVWSDTFEDNTKLLGTTFLQPM